MIKIIRFHILKISVFFCLLGILSGLILGLIFAVFAVLNTDLTNSLSRELASFGVSMVWILPILLGTIGFLSGIILTPLANWILKIVKGINIDAEILAQ